MTRIDFYTHVQDKLPVAIQLIGKAWDRGLNVWVRVADDAAASRLDQGLWTHPTTGFIPHCKSDHALAKETPIIIDAAAVEPSTDQILINLHPERPEYFSRFERLIEIVSLDDQDRKLARERFIFYRDRGFEIHSHDLSHSKI